MQNQRCTVIRASVLQHLNAMGSMRVDEFTVPGTNDYNESSHLFLVDILVDSHENPRLLRVKV